MLPLTDHLLGGNLAAGYFSSRKRDDERRVAAQQKGRDMSDIVQALRAAATVLLDCQEHVPIDGGKVLVNLHKRADEMNAAAAEIERLRLTDVERVAIESAAKIIDAYDEEMDGFSSGAAATLRGLLGRMK